MIEAVLAIEPRYHTFVDRLNNDYRAIEIGLCIHVPYNPVNKCTKEVSFTKLNNSLRCYALGSCKLV